MADHATSVFLGLDLGTSSVKALLVRENGTVAGRGAAEYPTAAPRPGYAEQDPEEWWRACGDAVGAALRAAGPETAVAALGLTGQMHGTVLLGADQRPLAPAVIWSDQRAADQVHEITGRIGARRLIALAGTPLATGFQAATLRWCQTERPDLWARTSHVLLPKDEIRRRLTGVLATEPSDACGTALLDISHRDWSDPILAEMDWDRTLFPPVVASTAITGHLGPDAADALGLAPGIPVVGGDGDAPAAALAAGIRDPRTLFLTLSTGAQVLLPATTVETDPLGRSHTFCAALDPGPDRPGWYRMGATLTAGMALRWLRDRVFALDKAEAYPRLMGWADEAPPGANGLLFVPYLTGERTPHMDPNARGAFVGLTAAHGRSELVRAVLEGVVFACADAFAVLAETGSAPSRIVLAGGGARSPLWRQIVADVFGLPVLPLATADGSALGAALLAAIGSGALDPAASWAVYEAPVEPDPATHARYRDLVALFRRQYAIGRETVHALAAYERNG
ncbi:MAG: Xylulose kinase [uncultured Thermomicrobiales bacterium]|uniref:Xylulose kinase n=1 Tax=uncultured Thermomicrobiales bacterium TaxID=1645740 RepID=A0A6J4THT5_9BACT|nr:MAG: Xylulose kinase [uncultured Thermomicrobiales bacterium]